MPLPPHDLMVLLNKGLKIHSSSPYQLTQSLPQHSLEHSEVFDGTENQLQKDAEQYLHLKGLEYLHMRKCKGNKKGWPDLTILLPNGKVVFVELKVKGGRLRQEQKEFKQIAIQGNHEYHECRSMERLIQIIKENGA